MTGISWKVKLLPIKALNSLGRGPDSAMVKAILYAADHPGRRGCYPDTPPAGNLLANAVAPSISTMAMIRSSSRPSLSSLDK